MTFNPIKHQVYELREPLDQDMAIKIAALLKVVFESPGTPASNKHLDIVYNTPGVRFITKYGQQVNGFLVLQTAETPSREKATEVTLLGTTKLIDGIAGRGIALMDAAIAKTRQMGIEWLMARVETNRADRFYRTYFNKAHISYRQDGNIFYANTQAKGVFKSKDAISMQSQSDI